MAIHVSKLSKPRITLRCIFRNAASPIVVPQSINIIIVNLCDKYMDCTSTENQERRQKYLHIVTSSIY